MTKRTKQLTTCSSSGWHHLATLMPTLGIWVVWIVGFGLLGGWSIATSRAESVRDTLFTPSTSPLTLPERTASDSLSLSSTTLLDGLVVEGERSKYDPNNPAMGLFQAVALVEQANRSRLLQRDFTYHKRDVLTLSLSNFDLENTFLHRLFPFFGSYVLPSLLDSTWTLPLSKRYELSEMGHRTGSNKLKEVILYREHVGLDENIDDGTMSMSLDELFPYIDLFEDQIQLLQNTFVSPFSLTSGSSYYRYHLLDTVVFRGRIAYLTSFEPMDSNSPALKGKAMITTTYPPRLLSVEFSIPTQRHLNFLDRIAIKQRFGSDSTTEEGKKIEIWRLQEESLAASFKLYKKLLSLYVEQRRKYEEVNWSPPDTIPSLRAESPTLLDLSSNPNAKSYVAGLPKEYLLVEDHGLKQFLEQIKSFPLYKTIIDASDMLSTGYLRTMWRHDKVYGGSKVDVGPIANVWGRNSTEGIRLRLGGRTTGYLHDHLFFDGYVAYGTMDKKWKYAATATYSINPKRYFVYEFPQHQISISYKDDIYLPGQLFENEEKDNILYNLGTAYLTNRSYRRELRAEYLNDLRAGFRVRLEAKRFEDRPVEGGGYVRVQRFENDTTIIRVPLLRDVSILGEVRWAPGERIYNGSVQRQSPFFRRFQQEVPVFFLRHEVGLPIWGGEVRRHKTEISVEHRLWLKKAGRLDYKVEVGKIWNSVPYPLLYTPPVNRAFWLNDKAFQVMSPYELIGDEWGEAFLQWHLRGLLLGRLKFLKSVGPPYFVVSLNYLMGHTSKQNKQEFQSELFVLPTVSTEMNKTHYAEVGLGIENILRVMRIDIYRRLTPAISPISPGPWAVRAKLGITF